MKEFKQPLKLVKPQPDRITVDMGDVKTEFGTIHVKIENMPREIVEHINRMAKMTGQPRRKVWARFMFYSSEMLEMSERASKRRSRS